MHDYYCTRHHRRRCPHLPTHAHLSHSSDSTAIKDSIIIAIRNNTHGSKDIEECFLAVPDEFNNLGTLSGSIAFPTTCVPQ